MNVKQLRALLDSADVLDEVELVVSGSDHSYRRAQAEIVTAESDGKRGGYLGEYYDDANMTPKYKKVRVLAIG